MHVLSTGEGFLPLPFIDEVFGIFSHGSGIGRDSEFERQAMTRLEIGLQRHGACGEIFDFLEEEATAIEISSDTTDTSMDVCVRYTIDGNADDLDRKHLGITNDNVPGQPGSRKAQVTFGVEAVAQLDSHALRKLQILIQAVFHPHFQGSFSRLCESL